MKKFLALIISFTIVFLSLANGIVAFASEAQVINLQNFADNLAEMVREHDGDNASYSETDMLNHYSNSTIEDYDKYSHLPKNAFLSKRLVVKSKRKIDYQGAIDCVSGYRDLFILQYDSFESTENAYDYYLTLDYIDYVEPDYIMRMQEDIVDEVGQSLDDAGETVSDVVDDVKDFIDDITHPNNDNNPSNNFNATALSWASDKIGFTDIKEELAKNVQDDYIQVAVLDSGIDTDHPFLEGRVLENNINFSNTGEPNSVEDDYGHGTHVAGIIVDNTLSNVKIKPYKVLNAHGNGPESLIAIAIDLAVAEGADIINMSLKSNGVFQTMIDSVNNAVAKDVNVVVAAGNDAKDLSKNYVTPACVESAFTVSATTEDNKLAVYSNYNGTVDICAPGNNIKSSYNNGDFVKLSGTSMATPLVVAGLAVVYTAYPDKTAKEAEEMLKEYSIFMFEEEGDNKFGAGQLYLKYILDRKPRTADPVFSKDSCTFSNSFTLTISCPERDAKIIYVTSQDDTVSVDFTKGEYYTAPITISLDTTVYAITISPGKSFSDIIKKEYNRANDTEEDMYDINTSGFVSGYFGSEIDLIVPEKIRGKVVKGIANGAFKDNEQIHSVTLPGTATKIMNEAFMGCTNLEKVSGSGINRVEKNAFYDSSIRSFPFEQLTYIGISAFAECENLQDVILTNTESIQAYAFENSSGIRELNSEKLTNVGTSAFCNTDIERVNIPNVTSLGSYVFKDCENLTSVSIPMVKTIAGATFENCTALKDIEIPYVESIGASAFRNTAIEFVFCYSAKTLGNFAFAENDNLALVSLPKVTTIGTYAFQGCPELQVVKMPALKILTNDSFSDCPKLLQLHLPSVETVNKGALEKSSVEYIQFDVVKTINSLPRFLKGLVAPSSLTSVGGNIPITKFVVYGYEGTYAETFAKENNKDFSTVPAIIYDLKEYVDPEDTFIMVYALGFNCQYQWYRNSEVSNVGGTPIDGATNYYYAPDDYDIAAAYYCVITSNDGVNSNTITTDPIRNSHEIIKADLTEYFNVLTEAATIDRSIYDEDELAELDALLEVDVSNLTISHQERVDDLVAKIKAEIEDLTVAKVLGDLNDDGFVTAIDARIALQYVAELVDLKGKEIVSGDMDNDGDITVLDVRFILQKASE